MNVISRGKRGCFQSSKDVYLQYLNDEFFLIVEMVSSDTKRIGYGACYITSLG
jgi:hypothetical protein